MALQPAAIPRSHENKLENAVLFFSPNKALFPDHVHHTLHHTFTTKTPRRTIDIFQNTLEKRP
jgi:hypothetical protein